MQKAFSRRRKAHLLYRTRNALGNSLRNFTKRKRLSLVFEMEGNARKKKEGVWSERDCVLDSCMFPRTCKWNLKCMQKALDSSMGHKEMRKMKGGKEDNKQK